MKPETALLIKTMEAMKHADAEETAVLVGDMMRFLDQHFGENDLKLLRDSWASMFKEWDEIWGHDSGSKSVAFMQKVGALVSASQSVRQMLKEVGGRKP